MGPKIFQITIISKMRSFQYKLMFSAILTNQRLFYAKIKDTQKCDFCSLETETPLHLFFTCSKVQTLWRWLETKIGCPITAKAVAFNNIVNNPKFCQNALVLYVKFYIYKSKCLNVNVTVADLEKYIKSMIVLEEEIAKRKQRLNHHKLKWENYLLQV